MKRAWLLVATVSLSTSAQAQLVEDPLQSDTTSAPEPSSELKSLADTCSAHKFETMVQMPGRRRGSTVRICGKPGQTDAEWLITLKDSVTKTKASEEMAQSVKDQIVAALGAEIERLEGHAAAMPTPGEDTAPVSTVESANIEFNLKPVAPREPAPEYSSLPPLPTPKKAAPVRLSNSTGGVVESSVPEEPLIRPRLTLSCAVPHETFAACTRFERDSQVLVRASEDMPPSTSLRFLRNGDMRAELDLGSLKAGQSLKEKLPARVCSGVLRGKVQVQVVTKGRVAETMGPYNLYCGS